MGDGYSHFLVNNGVLMSNMHTPLIAHTANDSLTTYTGLYRDRVGMPISNSYRTYNPDAASDPAGSPSCTGPIQSTALQQRRRRGTTRTPRCVLGVGSDGDGANDRDPGTLGAVHARRLRCRRCLGRQPADCGLQGQGRREQAPPRYVIRARVLVCASASR